MKIVVALDVHRSQITFKALDRESGELRRGRIAPATRAELRAWLSQFADGQAEFAVEGTTGWHFVVEEIARAGQLGATTCTGPCATARSGPTRHRVFSVSFHS